MRIERVNEMTAPPQARPAGTPVARGQIPVTPGRRRALSMGVPVLLVLIGWLALSAVALVGQGSFPVRDTIPVADGQVSAQINSGDITLRQAAASAGPATAAKLTGTAHYSLFRPAIRVSGSTVTFPCSLPVGDCSLTATLQVPADTSVSLSTAGGDATIPGFTGSRLTVNTDGGNLTAGDLAGHLDLGTGGGDLTAAALDGPVQVNTDGGNLTVRAVRAPTASIGTGGGDVWLAYAVAPDSLQIISDGGNVTLMVPPGQYKVYANADGGAFSNGVGDDPSAAKSITVDSGGGNITIRAAS
jgi:hypothetical protein